MLIVALVLAVIGLAALVTAVVTSNELIAWVCIAASSLGVILLIVDAIRERQVKRTATTAEVAAVEADDGADDGADDEVAGQIIAEEMSEEDHPEEVVHDDPDYDTYSDDEPEYPAAAEESALHIVSDVDAEEAEKSAD